MMHAFLRKRGVWLAALTTMAACVTGSAATSSTVNATPATTTAATTTSVGAATASNSQPPTAVEHRIGVRVVDGAGEFFDRTTGDRFVPRGVNLIRLSGGAHSTLDVGRYDSDQIEATFSGLVAGGFNVVRVFLNSQPGGMPGVREPLSSEYLDNVVDLLDRAKKHDLQVVLTQDWLPESEDWTFSSDPLIDNVNSMYLSIGGLETNGRFYREWVGALVGREAALDALFAYELRNELYLTELYAPFDLATGTVATANGLSYDLAEPGAQRRLLEDGLVFWAETMRAEILAIDPTALVTVGFFQPKGPNASRSGDDRIIETAEFILESNLDFIDLHGYPGGELDLGQLVENYGLPPVTEKPIVLGEFGAERGPHPTVDDAVRALVDWQVESCTHGFDGWMLWTWDTAEQPEFWTGIDENMAIAQALSPEVRPDPCQPGELGLLLELTAGALVRESAATSDGPGSNAVDGLTDTVWSSGAGPIQWIEFDLGEEHVVDSIKLLVA
ncbi:MAG: discoidin domain-containing protein, partial [Acidimicrobiia bacterium]